MDNRISILDSTLRDGGYCNNWEFGYENKKKIIKELINANIDIIECGILSDREYSLDFSQYSNINKIDEFIPSKRNNTLFVVLLNYGQYSCDKIPEYKKGGIDGIRVAFHKKDMNKALDVVKEIKEKNIKYLYSLW